MEVGKKVLYDRIEQRELPKRFQLCYCFFAFVTRFFTFISLFFPLLLLSLDGFCQPEGELGILGGMGSEATVLFYKKIIDNTSVNNDREYNPNRHFDRSQRYLGGFCRYNLNDRFALRLNAGFPKIDIRERSLLSNGETVYPAGFHCTVKDVAAWIEFDFRSFGCRK